MSILVAIEVQVVEVRECEMAALVFGATVDSRTSTGGGLKPITSALVTAHDLPYDVVAVGFVLAALREGCTLIDRASRIPAAKTMSAFVTSDGEVRRS